MKHLSFLLLIPLLLTSCGQDRASGNINQELNELAYTRINQLENSFRYKVLSQSGIIPKIQEVNEFFEQMSKLDEVSSINNQLKDFSVKYNIELHLLNSSDNKKSVLILNKLVVFDDLLYSALNTNNNFGQIMPIVELREETPNEAVYNIILHAYDSLFIPGVQLIAANDTFDILVDENTGMGKITLGKRSPNDKHQFKGDVVLWKTSESQERIPFSYPNKN